MDPAVVELTNVLIAHLNSLGVARTRDPVTSTEYIYDGEGDIDKIHFKNSDNTIFTLTFSYDAQKNLTGITRSHG